MIIYTTQFYTLWLPFWNFLDIALYTLTPNIFLERACRHFSPHHFYIIYIKSYNEHENELFIDIPSSRKIKQAGNEYAHIKHQE